MTDPCTFCTGSHYMADEPLFGPCACCTPEALLAVEENVDDLITHLAVYREKCDDMDALVDEVFAALIDYFVSIGLPAYPVVIDQKKLAALAQAIDDADDMDWEHPEL